MIKIYIKFEEDPISPASFYSNESEKIKLNWFLYEFSLSIYKDLKREIGHKLSKCKISDRELAEFSIYFSKGMKDIILQRLAGVIEIVYFSDEMIKSYFPDISDWMVDKMLKIISKSWDELLSCCEKCPTRCISEKDAYCTMFDKGPY